MVLMAIFLLAGAAVSQAATQPTKKSPAKAPAAAGQSTPSAAKPASAPVKEWGAYLDVAYELTYWEKAEIKEWREKRERELGKTLAAYIEEGKGKLTPPAEKPGSAATDEPQLLHPQKDYLRLAIAQTIDYLQNDQRESLNDAVRTLEKLKRKTGLPEIAYWTGFTAALQAMEDNDATQFTARVYQIWNNSIMYATQGEIASGRTGEVSGSITPYYYRNLVHLIVNRAIIEHKLNDLNALGPMFIMMDGRSFGAKDGEGEYFTTLVRRIAEGLAAPDSDRNRLNFTVAMIESKRLQQVAAGKIDAEGMSVGAQKAFEQSRLFNDYAIKWASSHRSSGVVTAVSDSLDATSFAIQRLASNEKAPAYKYFSQLPARDGSSALINAMAVFNDIAAYSDGGWEKAGYANREGYLKAAQRLWRAIMEMSLWTGDYYLGKLNAASDQQSIFDASIPMRTVLDSYLDFVAAQKMGEAGGVVPDSAYFGAAEAASKLAYAFLKVQTYTSDTTAYDRWFLYSMQATDLFPFDQQEVARTAAILKRDGRSDLFFDYCLPIANRLKQSSAVAKWLSEEKSDAVKLVRDYVDTVDKTFAAAAAGSGEGEATTAERAATVQAFDKLREELQRKPDHPVHRLLKAFYQEERRKNVRLAPTYW